MKGAFFDPEKMSAEDVQKQFKEISDFDRKCDYPKEGNDTFTRIMEYRDSIKPKL